MQAPAGHRVWLGATVALIFGLVLTWGLLQFGAAVTSVLYRLFLLLVIPALLAVAVARWREALDSRALALMLLGLFLLGQVALQPTLEARGYLHLSVGWIALSLSLWLTSRGRAQARFLVIVLVLLGVLEAFYGLVQSVGGSDFIGVYFRNMGRIATGTLINRNHYAALLNMLLPLALGLLSADQALKRSQRASRSESLAKTWIVLLGCSVMGVAVLLSQSRGGTLSLLMTLLFVALLLTFSRRKWSRRALSVGAAGVLLLLVLGMGAALGLEELLERFGEVDEGLSRVEVYEDTLRMLGDSPIIGVGPGMYQWRFRLYQTTQPGRLYDHAHNDYLETAAEWGIPLALLVWGFILWRFYRSSFLAMTAQDPQLRGIAIGTAGALFSILIHSLVDFSLQIPAVLMVFGCVAGLSWSLEFSSLELASEGGDHGRSRWIAPTLTLRLFLVVALLAAGWQTLQRSRADLASLPENGISGLERATQLDPEGPEPRYLLGMAYRDLPGIGDSAGAAESFSQAVRLNPYAWRYWLELSRTQELLGDPDQAEASLRVAVSLNPGSGEYRWRLANLLLRQGDAEQAVSEVVEAVRSEPQLAEPAVAMLMKFGVEASDIEVLLPDDRAALLRVLRTLTRVRTEAWDVSASSLSATIWQRLLVSQNPPTFPEVQFYLDAMFRSDLLAETRQHWLELMHANGISDSEFEQGGNEVWNGEFELELQGAPLGWQISRSVDFQATRAPGNGQSESTALEIEFPGTDNLSFVHVSQELLLESGATYNLSLALRSEDLSTDQGVFVEVFSRDPSTPLLATDPVLGSTEWRSFEGSFSMPQGSGRALIRLRRPPSQKLDNRLRGKVYLDSVRIEQVNQ